MNKLYKSGLLLSLIFFACLYFLRNTISPVTSINLFVISFATVLFFWFMVFLPKNTKWWVRVLFAALVLCSYVLMGNDRYREISSLLSGGLLMVALGLFIGGLFSKSKEIVRNTEAGSIGNFPAEFVVKKLKLYAFWFLVPVLYVIAAWIMSSFYVFGSYHGTSWLYMVAKLVVTVAGNAIFLSIIVLPIVMSLKTFGWGRGLLWGAIFSLISIAVELFGTSQFLGCGGFCGMAEIIFAAVAVVYGIVGFFIMVKNA